jgi:hypothetical protein
MLEVICCFVTGVRDEKKVYFIIAIDNIALKNKRPANHV